MYVWKQLPSTLFEVSGVETDDPYPKYDIIDRYCENFVAQMNGQLAIIHDESPLIGYFQLVPDKKTSIDDVAAHERETYCYDFHIEGSTVYGQVTSRGYRMEIKCDRPGKLEVGVLSDDDSRYAWEGEAVHRAGKGCFMRHYNIGPTSLQPRSFPLIAGKDDQLFIDGMYRVLATDANLFIFTHREYYPVNIISLVCLRDILDPNSITVYSNGWRGDGSVIDKSSKRDVFISKSLSGSVAAPKMWLRDAIILEPDKDYRLFLPGIYITAEHKSLHTSLCEARYVDPTTGMLNTATVWLGYLTSFITGTNHVMAVM
jgi:hypothetical protein